MCSIEIGWDKDLIDPNNGQNVARKEKMLRPSTWFPNSSENWKILTAKEQSLLPEFSLNNVTNYLLTENLWTDFR